jgi:hypothetical protein
MSRLELVLSCSGGYSSAGRAEIDMSSKRNTVLGSVAGSNAVSVRGAAEVLFTTAGKGLLSEGTRHGLRRTVVENSVVVMDALAPGLSLGAREASQLVAEQSAKQAAAVVVQEAARQTGRAALTEGAPEAVKALARETAKAAGREVLKGAAKAAGIGLVIDGAFGAYEGISAHRRGEMTKEQAFAHTAKEASTGAVATGVGVLLAAGLVAATGGAAAPVVFVVGAGGAIGAKQLLRRLVDGVAARAQLAARPLPVEAR